MYTYEFDRLKEALAPVRNELLDHPVYPLISDLDTLRCFSEHHVFAVWDFMSLLKSLQRELTCVSVPWVPVGSPETRYLINEIVTGEESDVDPQGRRFSHFELYLRAMEEMGANTRPITDLIGDLNGHQEIRSLISSKVPNEKVASFLTYTFDVALHAPVHVKAAVFTFGREDLIPDMFTRMIERVDQDNPGRIGLFKYYIERHIEVDGGHHSALAKSMVCELCGQDPVKWKEATEASLESLRRRIGLWDAVVEACAAEVS
jgi:hypothetical protein